MRLIPYNTKFDSFRFKFNSRLLNFCFRPLTLLLYVFVLHLPLNLELVDFVRATVTGSESTDPT